MNEPDENRVGNRNPKFFVCDVNGKIEFYDVFCFFLFVKFYFVSLGASGEGVQRNCRYGWENKRDQTEMGNDEIVQKMRNIGVESTKRQAKLKVGGGQQGSYEEMVGYETVKYVDQVTYY